MEKNLIEILADNDDDCEVKYDVRDLKNKLIGLRVAETYIDSVIIENFRVVFADKSPYNQLTIQERKNIGYINSLEHLDMIHLMKTGKSWVYED
jgi:hypothetical protein